MNVRQFKSFDVADLKSLGTLYMIKRDNGWVKPDLAELPKPGETVEIDGKPVVVSRSEFTHGSCGWCGHVVIFGPRP